MEKHEFYDFTTEWSDSDNEWIGLCTQMPNLSWLAPTRNEALSGIIQLLGEVLEDEQV